MSEKELDSGINNYIEVKSNNIKQLDWELFPLSYYYADGVEPEKFDPFKFMEQEMLDYNLQKSKNEEFVL